MAEILVKESNFASQVEASPIPVLVDFWATWCGPCRMLAPVVKEIAQTFEGRLTVGKVNVDEEQALAMRFGIESIPTLLLFQNGTVTKTMVGYQPKAQLEDTLNKLL